MFMFFKQLFHAGYVMQNEANQSIVTRRLREESSKSHLARGRFWLRFSVIYIDSDSGEIRSHCKSGNGKVWRKVERIYVENMF